ncbi:hypothetical protein Bbelb_131820 [Branchiostoma belcheri]|nr:hypothetical protein Bbelb_131820 [Branchiostoma belcheri]
MAKLSGYIPKTTSKSCEISPAASIVTCARHSGDLTGLINKEKNRGSQAACRRKVSVDIVSFSRLEASLAAVISRLRPTAPLTSLLRRHNSSVLGCSRGHDRCGVASQAGSQRASVREEGQRDTFAGAAIRPSHQRLPVASLTSVEYWEASSIHRRRDGEGCAPIIVCAVTADSSAAPGPTHRRHPYGELKPRCVCCTGKQYYTPGHGISRGEHHFLFAPILGGPDEMPTPGCRHQDRLSLPSSDEKCSHSGRSNPGGLVGLTPGRLMNTCGERDL